METILVPIDFSDTSLTAAHAGATIAGKLNSRLFLLHVIIAPSNWNKMPVQDQQKFPEIESQIVEANIKLEKLSLDKSFEGIEVIPVVHTGIAFESIIEFAIEYEPDLIIIGAHGTGETDTQFIGSTTQRVIRLAPCGVISIKQGEVIPNIDKILFVSDFEEDISGPLDKTIDLASAFDATVELVYINTPAKFKDTQSVESAMHLATPRSSSVKVNAVIFNDYESDRGILHFIERSKPQLVTIVTHAKKSKPTYLIGITDTILFHSKVPILSFILKK